MRKEELCYTYLRGVSRRLSEKISYLKTLLTLYQEIILLQVRINIEVWAIVYLELPSAMWCNAKYFFCVTLNGYVHTERKAIAQFSHTQTLLFFLLLYFFFFLLFFSFLLSFSSYFFLPCFCFFLLHILSLLHLLSVTIFSLLCFFLSFSI